MRPEAFSGQSGPDAAKWRPLASSPGSARLRWLLCHRSAPPFLGSCAIDGRLAVTDSRIQPAVDHIQKQVQNQDGDRYYHNDSLNFGVVPVEYAIDEELTHPPHHEGHLEETQGKRRKDKLLQVGHRVVPQVGVAQGRHPSEKKDQEIDD